MAAWTPEVLAYAAGLIDGEGTINVTMKKGRDRADGTRRGGGSCGRFHELTIQVSNTDARMIQWLFSQFGGTLNVRDMRKYSNARTQYRWVAHSRLAGTILRAVLPYLVTKKEHAELGLQLRATVVPTGQRLASGVKEEREGIRRRIRVLNRRGVAA